MSNITSRFSPAVRLGFSKNPQKLKVMRPKQEAREGIPKLIFNFGVTDREIWTARESGIPKEYLK